jgi:hypothetical protein
MPAFSGNTIYYAYLKGKAITYKILIKKSGYSGAATEIVTLSTSPLIYQHIDVEGSNVQGSEMIFQFVCSNDSYSTHDQLTQGTDFEYKFDVIDLAQTDTTRTLWTGYILPSETSRSYFADKSVYTLTATDFLSRLKTVYFSNSDTKIPSTRRTISDMIGWCLDKIPDFYGTMVQCALSETNLSGAGSTFQKVYAYPKLFETVKNGQVVANNCYDVLDSICKVFNSRICAPFKKQSDYDTGNGQQVYILNIDEITSPMYTASYDAGTDGGQHTAYKTTSTFTSLVTIDSYIFQRESELSRKVPMRALNLIQHNYDFGATFTTDNFQNGASGVIWDWTNINTITTTGNTMDVLSNSATYCKIRTHNTYTISSPNGNTYIRIAFTLINKYDSYPLIPRIVVYKGGGVIPLYDILPKVYTNPNTGFLYKTYISYISPATAPFECFTGISNSIELRFDTHNGTAQVMKFLITDLQITSYAANNGQEVTGAMFDNIFEAYSVDGATTDQTIELKMGDSTLAGNKSSLTYSSADTALTAVWNRYGKTESKSIQELIMQSYFNRYGGDSKILKIKVYDPNDNISLKNKIGLEGLTYIILDIIKDFRSGWVDLRLLQISTSDISINIFVRDVQQSPTGITTSSSGVASSTGIMLASKHANLSGLDGDDHKQYLLRIDYGLTLTSANYVNNNYFDIPIRNVIDTIILETQDTTGGNFTIGSTAGVSEVASLTINTGCTSSANCTVTLNGVGQNVALTSGMGTTTVAGVIRGTSFSGWTTGGTGAAVTFTCNTVGTKTDATYSAGTTGATGVMTTTTQGSNASADVVSSVAIGTTANVLKNITFNVLDSLLSLTATKRIYIGLSTATTVKLMILTKKF